MPDVIAMKTLPLDQPNEAMDLIEAYREHGVSEVVHTGGYDDFSVFQKRLDVLCVKILPSIAGA